MNKLHEAAQQALDALERIDTLRFEDVEELKGLLRAALAQPAAPAQAKQWPFVETPAEFASRLHAAAIECGDMVAAVRNVLIENSPTFRTAPQPAHDNLACKSVQKRLAIQRGDAVQEPERVPPGHVVVPVEPTPEMLAAIIEPIKWAGGRDAYRAMLAAAPSITPKEPPKKVCRYPDCVDNGPEGKCTDWLVGECKGPGKS